MLSVNRVTVVVDRLAELVGPHGTEKTSVCLVVRADVDGLQLAVGGPNQDTWGTVIGQVRAWRCTDDAGATRKRGVQSVRTDERTWFVAFVCRPLSTGRIS